MSVLDRIEVDAELPGDGSNVWYYPGGQKGGVVRAYGKALKIRASNGRSWFGVFANGEASCSGLWQFNDDPNSFVIVQRGAGYHVQIDDPSVWHELPISPFIGQALFIPGADVLTVFDFTDGAGYGSRGVLWRTPRLALDGLEIISSDSEKITLSADLSVLRRPPARIVLDVRDGRFLEGKPFNWGDMGFQEVVVADTPDAR